MIKLSLTKLALAATSVALMSACAATDSPFPERKAFSVEAVTSAPQRHTASVVVSADKNDIYEYISNSENWVAWFPPYQSVAMSNQGAQRTFTFADGKTTLTEDLVSLRRPNSFAWSFTPSNPLGVTDHVGVLTLSEVATGTRVSLTTHYNHPQPDQVAPQFEGGGQVILGAISAQFK